MQHTETQTQRAEIPTQPAHFVMLTQDQLKRIVRDAIADAVEEIRDGLLSSATPPEEPRYVKGMQALADALGVSRTTVYKFKDNILKGALSQNGSIIIADVYEARRLFREAAHKGQL